MAECRNQRGRAMGGAWRETGVRVGGQAGAGCRGQAREGTRARRGNLGNGTGALPEAQGRRATQGWALGEPLR